MRAGALSTHLREFVESERGCYGAQNGNRFASSLGQDATIPKVSELLAAYLHDVIATVRGNREHSRFRRHH